jgi:hypothetical protein
MTYILQGALKVMVNGEELTVREGEVQPHPRAGAAPGRGARRHVRTRCVQPGETGLAAVTPRFSSVHSRRLIALVVVAAGTCRRGLLCAVPNQLRRATKGLFRHPSLVALRHRNFRLLWIGLLLSFTEQLDAERSAPLARLAPRAAGSRRDSRSAWLASPRSFRSSSSRWSAAWSPMLGTAAVSCSIRRSDLPASRSHSRSSHGRG